MTCFAVTEGENMVSKKWYVKLARGDTVRGILVRAEGSFDVTGFSDLARCASI